MWRRPNNQFLCLRPSGYDFWRAGNCIYYDDNSSSAFAAIKGTVESNFFYLYSRRINVAIKGPDFVIFIRYKFLCHHDGNIVDHVELFFRSLDSLVIFRDFTN